MVTRKGNNVAKKLATKYPFGLSVSISKFWVFFFFFFPQCMNSKIT